MKFITKLLDKLLKRNRVELPAKPRMKVTYYEVTQPADERQGTILACRKGSFADRYAQANYRFLAEGEMELDEV